MQSIPQLVPHRPIVWLGAVAAVSLAFSGIAHSADKYDGGQPANPKDLKGKKVVIADVPKVIGIGYFDATSKGIKAGADDLTKSGVDFEVTSDAPTEADIGKQIEFLDNAISRGVDGLMFAANDPVAISPVLRKALKAGIPVIGYDADSEPDARSWLCNKLLRTGWRRPSLIALLLKSVRKLTSPSSPVPSPLLGRMRG